jgi:hypothetical protein
MIANARAASDAVMLVAIFRALRYSIHSKQSNTIFTLARVAALIYHLLMAAPALDVDKDAIKLLAIQHGVREAARMSGLAESTVQHWSRIGKWIADLPRSTPLPASIRPSRPQGYVSAPDAHLAATRNLQVRGRIASLKASTAALEDLATRPAHELNQPQVAGVLHLQTKTAKDAGGWDAATPITATDLRAISEHPLPSPADADGLSQDVSMDNVMDISPLADDEGATDIL